MDYVSRWQYASRASAIPVAVGSSVGYVPFYRTNVPTGSSLLKPQSEDAIRARFGDGVRDYFYPYTEMSLDTVTLAGAISDFDNGQPAIIKLDTQGYEQEILRSLQTWIENGRLVGIESEASLLMSPLYTGATKFHELQAWLESLGWELLAFHLNESREAVGTKHGGKMVPAECDVVFGPGRDLMMSLEPCQRLTFFAFLCSNRLFAEAANVLRADSDLSVRVATEADGLRHLVNS
jgi:FkbM family methyltransferase